MSDDKKKPAGLARLRANEWPWLTETADLMEEMAEVLEAEEYKYINEDRMLPRKLQAVLKRYRSWK